MQERIEARAQQAITEQVFPGCVVGVGTPEAHHIFPVGYLTYDRQVPVEADTIYDIASVTKKVANSCSLLTLVDKGQVALEDPVAKYLPEFGNSAGKESVTVWHLLTYTLDLEVPAASSLKDRSPEEIIEVMVQAPLRCPPGERVLYTNSTAILRGLVFERAAGVSLDKFTAEYFYWPLGMLSTSFYPEQWDQDRIAPTEIDDWRGREIRGEVHDECTYTLQQGGYYLGAAGLFSTVRDLLTFMIMLLNGGEYEGGRYFSPDLVKAMHSDQLPDLNRSMGLGWDLNSKFKMGGLSSDQVFGHSGFTGSMVQADPIKNIAVVTLSNRTYPRRPPDTEAINQFRRDIADIVFEQSAL